ncbi:MAG: zf-TFIIB domain-containing protein [Paracoccaceae bacterium]
MKCPVDGTTLSMTERSGVEIDFCPTCRGVWLDRGELDKLVAASAPRAEAAAPPAAARPRAEAQRPWRDDDDDDDRGGRRRGGRRESFLSDLFDF